MYIIYLDALIQLHQLGLIRNEAKCTRAKKLLSEASFYVYINDRVLILKSEISVSQATGQIIG